MPATHGRLWTNDDTKRLRELHAQGLTLTAISKEMGRSKSSVSQYAAQAGLTFDRSATASATQALVTDAKSRRAALQLALLGDAERLREQLWTEAAYAQAVGGMDAQVMRWTMTEPTPTDKLKLMQAAGAAIDRSLKLDDHDSGQATTVIGLLQRTAEALGIHDATDTAPP